MLGCNAMKMGDAVALIALVVLVAGLVLPAFAFAGVVVCILAGAAVRTAVAAGWL